MALVYANRPDLHKSKLVGISLDYPNVIKIDIISAYTKVEQEDLPMFTDNLMPQSWDCFTLESN